jgi:tetratricopeptide (TPR) repeat protein
MTSDWQTRIDAVWTDADNLTEDQLVAAIDALAAERPEDDALALFERGGAQDSTGHPDVAVPLYRAAIAAGLPEDERAQATIQLASSLRNLGRANESLALLRDAQPYAPYAVATAAITALTLATLDRPLEGLATLLREVAPTLPRYQRSMRAYADDLLDPVVE